MIEFNGKMIATDDNGYLLNSHDWNVALAEVIAEREAISLTDEHWQVIHLVRQFYQEFNTSPAIRMLVKAMQQHFGDEKGNSRYLQRLFPGGPAKQATKIAGLPKPVRCI